MKIFALKFCFSLALLASLIIPLKGLAQVKSIQASFYQSTSYPSGYTQDPMYFFCDASLIDLYAESPSGSPLNFEWSRYDPISQSYQVFKTENNVISSNAGVQNAGGFRVKLYDTNGNLIDCYKAWAFITGVEVDAQLNSSNCKEASLSGTFNPLHNFTYYVLPEEPFIIDANTIIKACFSIDHTQVSDVGFMIYGPTSAGYPAVTIYPHPNAQNNPPQSLNCNVGNNFIDLCFESNLNIPYPVCALPTPITGNYGWYKNGFNVGGGFAKYPIGSDNIALLYGAKATDPGWQVQFFDGTVGNTGTVKEVTLTFINPNPNSYSPDTVILKSGQISFPITDNADRWTTAAKYNVPAYIQNTPTTPITIDYINNTISHVNGTQAMQWTATSNVQVQSGTLFSPANALQTNASGMPVYDSTLFTLTVADEYGCWFSDSVKYLHQIPKIDSVTIHPALCQGDQNGELIIHSIWADQFSIDSGATSVASNLFINLTEGEYQIMVTDNNGCFDTLDVILPPAIVLNPTVIQTNNTCFGAYQGNILVQMAGGQSPYQFQWSNSPFNMNLVGNLCAGNYQLTVTDNHGCDTTLSFQITDPPVLSVQAAVNSSSCVSPSGSAQIASVSGGVSPYTYQWSNNQSGSNIQNVYAGTYYVTVTDQNNCSSKDTVIIPQLSTPQVSLNIAQDTSICYGSSVDIVAQAGSGVGPYTYTWAHGSNASQILVTPNLTTCYSLTVTDQNQCQSPPKNICIEVYSPITSLSDVSLYHCEGTPIHLNAAASGGNPNSTLSYTWSHNLGTSTQVEFIPPFGWPQVEVFEAVISDGCSLNDTIRYSLSFYEPPQVNFSANPRKHCIPMEVEFTNLSNAQTNCLWNFGDGSTSSDCATTSHTYEEVGIYPVTLSFEYGNNCTRSLALDSFIIAVAPPHVDFSIDPSNPSIYDQTLLVQDQSKDSVILHEWFLIHPTDSLDTLYQTSGSVQANLPLEQALWQNGPDVYHFDDQQLPLIVMHQITNELGCVNQITKKVEWDKETQIYAPSAFTPGIDGLNDGFKPLGLGIHPQEEYRLMIIDRWGHTIFETQDISVAWNGTFNNQGQEAQDGTYLWQLRYVDIKNKIRETQGSVTLLKR